MDLCATKAVMLLKIGSYRIACRVDIEPKCRTATQCIVLIKKVYDHSPKLLCPTKPMLERQFLFSTYNNYLPYNSMDLKIPVVVT